MSAAVSWNPAPFETTVGAAGALTGALSDRFFANLARLGQRRSTDPVFFLTVWNAESGLNPGAKNPNGGAQGLNQMMPATLRGLGAPADFAGLAGEQQLPWIERLIVSGEALNGGPFGSSARYYHSNFYPATMRRGSSPDTVVVAADAADAGERAAYAANKGLDVDGNGKITLADLASFLERAARSPKYEEAFFRLADAVDHLPAPGVTWDDGSGDEQGRGGGGRGAGAVVAAILAIMGLGALAGRRRR